MGFQALLRIGGALAVGLILSRLYAWGGWLQEPNVLVWQPKAQDEGLLLWTLGQARNLSMIFVIITALNTLMRLLTAVGLTDLCA